MSTQNQKPLHLRPICNICKSGVGRKQPMVTRTSDDGKKVITYHKECFDEKEILDAKAELEKDYPDPPNAYNMAVRFSVAGVIGCGAGVDAARFSEVFAGVAKRLLAEGKHKQ